MRRAPIPTHFPYTTLFRSPTRRSVLIHGCALLSLFTVGSSLTRADVIDEIQKAGVIKVGIFEDFPPFASRSEEHTSELQSQSNLVCRLLLEKKNHNSERRS